MTTKLYEGPPSGEGFPLGVIAAADFREGDDREGLYVAEGEGHRLIVGPPGTGKFTSIIAPLLLSADKESVIVFDVKNGEAAEITAAHRAKLGPVLVLDPFGISGRPSGSYNPLDALKADDPELLSKAQKLTDAIMMFKKGDATAEYFSDQAKSFMTALLIHVATAPEEEGQRNLRRVRQIIRRPFTPPADEGQEWANGEVFYAMRMNPVADGIVRDEAENLQSEDGRKNTFYVHQTLRSNVKFLDLPQIQQISMFTSPEMEQLKNLRTKVGTVYVVLPEDQMSNLGRWLRIIYSLIIDQVKIGGRRDGAVRLHLILDEFPSMGYFERVSEDMALVRDFKINMHIVVQSLMHLQKLYGDAWETFNASSRYQQFLGANDLATAKYLSEMLGTRTGYQISESHNRAQAGGSQGTTRSPISVPLVAVHEVMQLEPGRTIVVRQGEKPLYLRKWHYYGNTYLSVRASARTKAA